MENSKIIPFRKTSNRTSNLLNHYFGNDVLDWFDKNYTDANTTLPAVNIKEDDNSFEVEVAAPGFEKNHFKIEVNNDVLTISSEKKEEKEENKKGFSRKEFNYQSFKRSFNLPNTLVEEDKISAEYRNGILRVMIPKKEEAKPKPIKQIEIK